jgi:hypothetical protein
VQFTLLGYLRESASAKILPKRRRNANKSILVATESSTTEVEHNVSDFHMLEEQANISQGMKMTFI